MGKFGVIEVFKRVKAEAKQGALWREAALAWCCCCCDCEAGREKRNNEEEEDEKQQKREREKKRAREDWNIWEWDSKREGPTILGETEKAAVFFFYCKMYFLFGRLLCIGSLCGLTRDELLFTSC